MIIQQSFLAESEAAAQRYGMLVESWRSLYQRSLDAADFGSARQFQSVKNQAYSIARVYLEAEKAIIEQAIDTIALEAQKTTQKALAVSVAEDFTEAVDEHLIDAEDYLASEISIQLERDINFLMQSLRKAVLQVTTAARAQRIAEKAALIQYRIGNAQELRFFFHDRRAQKWPSARFIRSVWRHSLLSAYNEVVLLTLAEHGIDKAEVRHLNQSAESNGMLISIATNSVLPTYAEIRNEIFHPNSDAILQPAGA